MTNGSASLTVVELERRLLAVEPATVLVPPRILRRIIKHDCKLPGMGLQVPHRKSYIIGREKALAIAGREELEIHADRQLPETLILLARPDGEKLNQRHAGVTLVLYWRLLFHARVHLAIAQRWRVKPPNEIELRRRIHQIGFTEFDEIRTVLRQEHFLLPPGDERTAYEEFAALYLELTYFAPGLVSRYFPALQDRGATNRLLAQEMNHRDFYQATRLEGAPDPDAFLTQDEESEESEYDRAEGPEHQGAVTPSLSRSQSLVRRADRALARGNIVRSGILRERAARLGPPDRAPGIRADARADLDRLATRLQAALELYGRAADEWRRALAPLLPRAAHGRWSVEARLLYDLQKVCIEHERGVYSVNLVDWMLAFGKWPLKRPLPGVRAVLMTNHLRKAVSRLRWTRLADEDRQPLASLLKAALHASEANLREQFRPLVQDVLSEVGLRPENLPERVAFRKLTEELLDRVTERGLLTIGDLRDAVSRNQLKLPDLGGVTEFFHGDRLIHANRKLAVRLDGVFRRGEVYMTWLERMSALAFGTPLGRWLTRYLAIPFGGAFVVLYAAEEILSIFAHLQGGSGGSSEAADHAVGKHHEHGPHLANFYSVGILGVFLLLLLHVPVFRRAVVNGLIVAGKVSKTLFVDLPGRIAQFHWIEQILCSWPVVLLHHYVTKPLFFTALIAGVCLLSRAGPPTTVVCSAAAFFVATAWLNTRLGRQFEEAFTDWYVRGWRYLWLELIPGVIRLSLEVFKRGTEAIERLLYTVDEWLRFRQGESRLSLIVKPILGVVWSFVAYFIRVILNLFVEPTFNPIKHFPTVTVAAKLITPMLYFMKPQMVAGLEPLLGRWLANGAIWIMIGLVPGFAGFLVWEFKENWKLYAANRAKNLRAIIIGHHGETTLRLLKPGFHSGTIARLYAKMRRASRWAQKTGDWRTFRKHRAALHHVNELFKRFVEREFLAPLEESHCWQGPPVTVDLIHFATNRIRVAFGCEDLSDDFLVVDFDERSGWLVVRIAEPGWVPRLHNEQRRVLVNSLIGLYKLAGVDLVHEQLKCNFPRGLACDVTDHRLRIWPSDTFAAEASYDLATTSPTLAPRVIRGSFPAPLPTVPSAPFIFAKAPVSWARWVEIWSKDDSGIGHPKAVIHSAHMFPDDSRQSELRT
jgi:hypothetical protein